MVVWENRLFLNGVFYAVLGLSLIHIFGYKKTVYRGLMKNENRLYALFACANLYALAMAGRKLSTT